MHLRKIRLRGECNNFIHNYDIMTMGARMGRIFGRSSAGKWSFVPRNIKFREEENFITISLCYFIIPEAQFSRFIPSCAAQWGNVRAMRCNSFDRAECRGHSLINLALPRSTSPLPFSSARVTRKLAATSVGRRCVRAAIASQKDKSAAENRVRDFASFNQSRVT